MPSTKPTLNEEKLLWAQGYSLVAGVDEVGRGCLAGPVAAAAVIMPQKFRGAWRKQVRDSKLITAPKREELAEYIKDTAISFGFGLIDNTGIDTHGIAKASRLAMKMAIDLLKPPAEYLLVDYFQIPEVHFPQKGVVDGDTLCFSIACASIVAKVTRDALMVKMDGEYPGYNFAENKGYSTQEHIECLQKLGPCTIHRRSFEPVKERLL